MDKVLETVIKHQEKRDRIYGTVGPEEANAGDWPQVSERHLPYLTNEEASRYVAIASVVNGLIEQASLIVDLANERKTLRQAQREGYP